MKFLWCIFLLILFMACAHKPAHPVYKEHVTVQTALDHLRQSYILGCVEAYRRQNISQKYQECRDFGLKHEESVKALLESPISDDNNKNIQPTKPEDST
jgi:hypothetical protein